MTRLIKRYGNRKMYDTQESRYVTLDNVAELVRAGEDLRIIDNDSGEDLTAVTFAQIIFEEEKRKDGVLGLPVLRRLIRQGGEAVQELLSSVDRGREALGSMREMAEKGVKQLVQGVERRGTRPQGNDTRGGRALLDILELPQKQLELLQHRIDAQVRTSLERVTGHPAVQNELRRIEDSIKGLEHQLGRLRRRGAAARHTKARRPKKGGDR
jgi:polyhydroxyalkanoate synthesis repressor PhaR